MRSTCARARRFRISRIPSRWHGCSNATAGLRIEDLEPDDERVRARFREEFAPLASAPEEGRGFREAVRTFIAEAFGPEVIRLVEAVTEEKAEASGEPRAWIVRKREAVAHLAHADAHVAALKAADVAHNVRSILADLDAWGARVLGRFNATPDQALWYYQSVSVAVARRLAGRTTQLPALLAESVKELARRIG